MFQVLCRPEPSQACKGCPDPASSCSMPCQSLKGAKGCPAPRQGTSSTWREAYVTMSSALQLQARESSELKPRCPRKAMASTDLERKAPS